MAGNILDFTRYQIATGLSSGRSPIAPGTVGSMVGLILVYLLWPSSTLLQLAAIAVVTLLGVHTGGWLAEAQDDEDPSVVVIDEIVGIMITFFLLPQPLSMKSLIAGFLLFRIFDIWKPWPICKAEELPGGWGIMADDIVAGIFACLCLHLLLGFVF